MTLFLSLLWAAAVSVATADWASVLEDVRKEQAGLWKNAENWVASAQGYNGQWSGDLSALEAAATEAMVASKGHESAIKKAIANKCPAACQTDPMQLIAWQNSAESAHMNAQKTQYKRETADLEAGLHEVQTLKERFDPFVKKTNILHFKVKEEFEKFEDTLNDILDKTKEASLIHLRSSQGITQKRKMAAIKRRGPIVDTIKEKEIGRINMMKAACAAMETTYKEAKTLREGIDSRKQGEKARYESTIKKMEEKTKKATDDSKKLDDVYGGFASICTDESNKYIARSSDLGGLEPPELKEQFVAELDRHHLWWKGYCDDMASVIGLVQGWLTSCKTAWRDSTMGAEERILDVTGMANPANADDFKKATEGVCKTQAEFEADLASVEQKVADLSAACGDPDVGGKC